MNKNVYMSTCRQKAIFTKGFQPEGWKKRDNGICCFHTEQNCERTDIKKENISLKEEERKMKTNIDVWTWDKVHCMEIWKSSNLFGWGQ